MSRWNRYGCDTPRRDRDDYKSDRGGNDEYYVSYCPSCNKKTEHDVCTDRCVDC